MLLRRVLLATFQHQTLYGLRTDLHLLKWRLMHALRREDPNRRKPLATFLNVGCGMNGLIDESWYNLDAYPTGGVDWVHDAGRGLPFPAHRFQGIYAEHFLEHLMPDRARCFLAASLRVLRPGGVLRLSVPDGELYLRHYFDDRDWMLQRRGGRFHTPMAVVNEVFRQGYEHHYCFDFETLSWLLRDIGYVNIERTDFAQGILPGLLIDQESRRFESLFVEAQSPE